MKKKMVKISYMDMNKFIIIYFKKYPEKLTQILFYIIKMNEILLNINRIIYNYFWK